MRWLHRLRIRFLGPTFPKKALQGIPPVRKHVTYRELHPHGSYVGNPFSGYVTTIHLDWPEENLHILARSADQLLTKLRHAGICCDDLEEEVWGAVYPDVPT